MIFLLQTIELMLIFWHLCNKLMSDVQCVTSQASLPSLGLSTTRTASS